jgi:endonuclease/exonuclease/phosphatase (EEP) superfamily protein YafD
VTRPAKDHLADSTSSATESGYRETAALGAKATAMPHRLEPRAGQVADTDHSESTTVSDAHRRPRGVVFWLVCLITLSLIAIASLRIFYHDGTHFLIWTNAFTRYVYLPAYACLAWAVWRRRWLLALANVAVVCLHIGWVAPDFMRDRRFDSAVGDVAAAAHPAKTVRIFFANVNGANTEYQSLLHEIQEANPDVIMLAEFSSRWQMAFLHSPVIAAYPYGDGLQNARLDSVSVFSKLPLKSERHDWVAGRAIQTIKVPVDSETLRIIGLHSPRPTDNHRDNYDAFWNYTIPLLLSEQGPQVVVGDCNATQYSVVYQRLTANRLRSAHEDRGRGYATSWPNGYYPLPPIRIDQAFLSPEVECLSIREGEGRGSDHKPLILDVRIRPNH